MQVNKVADPKGLREFEALRAQAERQEALLNYVAVMADVELPEEPDDQGGDESE